MLDSEGLPPYPPARNAWEFPPPPVMRRWRWISITSTVLGVVLAVVLVAVLVDLESRDAPGLIDDDAMVSIIDRECTLMRSTVESMPVAGTERQQARTIVDQNRAVERMIDAIESEGADRVDADRPTRQWLDDWAAILDARERFSEALVDDPDAELDMPLDPDGDPVHLRMSDVWLGATVCEVPAAILSPYPDQAPASI